MLNNGYSEVTRWINENPEEYKQVMKEIHMLEDEERKGIKSKKEIFNQNFSVKGLEIFITPDYNCEKIEIPF